MTPLIRALAFLCLAALGSVPAWAADARLGKDVVPTFQSISLKLDADSLSYTGTTHIELEAKQATQTFRFHARGVTLDKVSMTGGKNPLRITTTIADSGQGLITATLDRKISPARYTLDIVFHDTFNTDAVGLYRMEKDGRAYAFTQFEADYARDAFPCWDEPSFKIPYQLTLSVPQDEVAIANTMPEKESVKDGWKTTVFKTTKPLPSYLLAIATGDLEWVEIPGLGVPGRVVTVKGQSKLAKAAVETTPPLLHALEAYFGTPYPYDKLDLIAVPEYWAGAMENAGAITYTDRALLIDPGAETVHERQLLVRYSAHELAHMWFGDLVTMQWWDDLWLNESFADWMGDKITQQVHPEYSTDLSAVQDGQGVMFQDARPSTRAIRQPVDSTVNLFENVGLAYDKGKAVLSMFERWIGPETFQKGVNAYLKAHANGNATADDLWKELDRASGRNVSHAMAGFIEQPGFPLVEVRPGSNGTFVLSQRRFANYGVDQKNLSWQIPLTLKFQHDGKVESRNLLLDTQEQTVDLGKNVTWIYPNQDAYGYFRWNVPPDMMKTLAASSTTLLSPRERIGLISNTGALLTAGAIHGDDYLRTIEAMGQDPEPLVLVSLLDALENVKAVIPTDASIAFAGYVRRTLGPALETVGMKPTPGEPQVRSLLRPRLLALLGDEGRDASVQSFAESEARRFLDDPSSVDPGVAGTVLVLAAHNGDRALFDAYKAHAEAAKTPAVRSQFLNALGAFRNPEIRAAALDYALSGPLRPNEIGMVARATGSDEAGREQTYRWMTDHYDAITARIPAEFATFMPFYAAGCSEERLQHARAFFSDPKHQVPGQDVQLAEVADMVNDCVHLREREGEAMATYLNSTSQAPSAHHPAGSPR
jgi:aminopeptidase N